MRISHYLLIILSLVAASCKKDFREDAKTILPPETFMVVDRIDRQGETRYTTTIEAHWWGYSEGGIISGFEVSTDGMQSWTFTKNQSGTFLLAIPPGQDSADIVVFVRAIDHAGRKDPTPASTAYPVKNTRPRIAYDNSFGRRSSTFPAFRLYWTASDTDGLADVQQIDISFNDTNHIFSLSGNTNAVTLADDASFTGQFSVYQNTKTTPLPGKLNGILYDSLNYIFIRAIDRAGAKSLWVKDSIRVRKPKSTVLLINDYTSNKNQPFNFYQARLANIGIPASVQESVSQLTDELPGDPFTIKKALGYFDRIVWFSNNPDVTLFFAQQNTVDFFAAGGRMMLVVDVGGLFPNNSSSLSFTPASYLENQPSGKDFRMAPGDSVLPIQPGWPVLTFSGSGISNPLRPYVLQPTSALYDFDSLYKANLTTIGGADPPARWNGNSLMISKRTPTGQTRANMIFSTLPLHQLNGNGKADSVFRKMAVEELGF